MDKERIKFENEILDKLRGKLTLLQDKEDRDRVIFNVFLEIYNTPEGKDMIRHAKEMDVERLFKEFLSYGLIEEFINDPMVEDIMINSLKPIFIHVMKKGLVKTDKKFDNLDELNLFIKKLIIFSGRQKMGMINNVELRDIQGRINIIFSPFGPQITITRAKELPLSVIDLIAGKSLSCELAAQLWIYIEGLGVKPANIIISGGPGSGKTTLLNALFSFIPSKDRLVVIEDTLELNTKLEENCARLESEEGLSMEDLVKNSLRMRPDRVIVGEVRGREAADLMTAMNIGKYCMGTLHASTARETVIRLQNEPMNVPEVLINLVDVFIIMRRFNTQSDVYRVVGEVVETAGLEKKIILLSPSWEYDYVRKEFEEVAVSSIYRDRLAKVSGATAKEVMDEVKRRSLVLKAMLDKDIKVMSDVTRICRLYIENPSEVLNELGLK